MTIKLPHRQLHGMLDVQRNFEALEQNSGATGPAGPAGPAGATGATGATGAAGVAGPVMPTIIHSGVTFTVASETQGVYQHPIQIDGVLHVDGILAAVN